MGVDVKNHYYIVLVIIICVIFASVFFIFPRVYPSDSDNDGVIDDIDAFPNDASETKDSDDDGVGDNLDAFPFDPSASVDSDSDGYPDFWNPGKTKSDSTSDPVLQLDAFPYDPAEWFDSDGDGVGDTSDVFPFDSTEWKDSDSDGVGDNKDSNPLVNLSFSLSINRCRLIRNVDLLGWGQLYIGVAINNDAEQIYDNNGDYWKVWKNRDCSLPVALSYEIDDSDGSSFTTLEISLYDADWLFEDDLVDINPDAVRKNIQIRIDHKSNSVDLTGSVDGSQAILWFDVILPELITPTIEIYNISYQWTFEHRPYAITLEIPIERYQWYLTNSVNRSPQMRGSYAMANFVTSSDSVIKTLAESLQYLADEKGFDETKLAGFVLSFVQQNIQYSNDNISKGVEEYWRYPVETLVEKQGDCEDSTLLYASLMRQLDIKTVLLFYIVDEGIGHLAAGISLTEQITDGYFVNYKDDDYYYCETTSKGFTIGDKPSDIPTDPELIIPLR